MKTIKQLTLAITGVVLLNGCTGFVAAVGSLSNSLGIGEKPHPPVAFMSSEQMLKTMISTTGTEGLGELTDPADDLIQTTYNERSGSLPSVPSLYQANGPTMIAAANLASSVCAKTVDRDRAIGMAQADERMFFRQVDFTQGPASAAAGMRAGFELLARNAWRRAPTSAEVDTFNTFTQEFIAGGSATDPEQTKLLAVGVCTAALSSLDALTY